MRNRSAPHSRPAAEPSPEGDEPAPDFNPARATRATGWTPERQTAFIEALSQSGCVHEACQTVGLSRQSAYGLRMRTDAQGFRLAWDAAIDLAMRRLSDECLSRALNGEAQPIFFQGEQIGERRRYDNRLAMFLLRYRDPLRYAASNDQMVYRGHPEKAALDFARARERMLEEAHAVSDTLADVGTHPDRTCPQRSTRAGRYRGSARDPRQFRTAHPHRQGAGGAVQQAPGR